MNAAGRRLQRWRLEVAKGERRALAEGIGSVLALCLVVLWLSAGHEATVTSVLHPATPFQAPLSAATKFSSSSTANGSVLETSRVFPQYGDASLPGRVVKLENLRLMDEPRNRDKDSLLVLVVLKDAESWGPGRGATDFFQLLAGFDYPKEKTSVTLLTSSVGEFVALQKICRREIHKYLQLAVVFRDDFSPQGIVTRENRHDHELQVNRRRVIARYRNFAVLSTMEAWHQHVVWLDADVHKVPAGLVKKMIKSGLDIVEPMCVRMKESGEGWYEYDLNAWVGRRKTRRSMRDTSFVPGDYSVKRMKQFHGGKETYVPLDAVGGTMLYVKADAHRQGVVFPVHHIIGSEWEGEGYDGIETEGLCYVAHFLGLKCWGMPNDLIYHI